MSAAAAAGEAPRRVAVLGAGAVGTLLGGLLAAAGSSVTLVDRRVPRDAPETLTLHEPDGRTIEARVSRAVAPAELAGAPDLVVVAVKMFDLAGALDDLAVWPAAPVLTIQNGIGAEELVASARPGIGLIAGSLTSPVERPGPAEVRWRGRGGIALAPAAGPVDAPRRRAGRRVLGGRAPGQAARGSAGHEVVEAPRQPGGERPQRPGGPRPGRRLRRPASLRGRATPAAGGSRGHARRAPAGGGPPRRRRAAPGACHPPAGAPLPGRPPPSSWAGHAAGSRPRCGSTCGRPRAPPRRPG